LRGTSNECFNSVDVSSRLVILFGWFRFVSAISLILLRFGELEMLRSEFIPNAGAGNDTRYLLVYVQ
jgi:hypothetical protein